MKNRKIVIAALVLNLLGGCCNAETIAEYSVTENTITEETSVLIALTDNADINVITNATTFAGDEHLDNDRIIIVPDENAAYTITPDVENGEIDGSMTYPDYRMSV